MRPVSDANESFPMVDESNEYELQLQSAKSAAGIAQVLADSGKFRDAIYLLTKLLERVENEVSIKEVSRYRPQSSNAKCFNGGSLMYIILFTHPLAITLGGKNIRSFINVESDSCTVFGSIMDTIPAPLPAGNSRSTRYEKAFAIHIYTKIVFTHRTQYITLP